MIRMAPNQISSQKSVGVCQSDRDAAWATSSAPNTASGSARKAREGDAAPALAGAVEKVSRAGNTALKAALATVHWTDMNTTIAPNICVCGTATRVRYALTKWRIDTRNAPILGSTNS